jgi:hypothetical protein
MDVDEDDTLMDFIMVSIIPVVVVVAPPLPPRSSNVYSS